MKMHVSIDAKVKRGPESWPFIYFTLALVLGIETAAITMLPLVYPYNLIACLLVTAVTVWLWISNRWLQNKLIGWKNRNEGKYR